MKDQSDDPSHHEQMLLSRSYILLPIVKDFFFKTFFIRFIITIFKNMFLISEGMGGI